MPELDYSVPKSDWMQSARQWNGATISSTRHSMAKKVADAGAWEPAVRKIVEFQHLGDDWDGQGGRAPSPELLESAIGLAYLLYERGVAPPDRVVSGVDASVI